MIRVHDHLPPEERADAEFESQFSGYLMLARMGFRVWLGTGDDVESMKEGTAMNKVRRLLDPAARASAGRRGTGDGREIHKHEPLWQALIDSEVERLDRKAQAVDRNAQAVRDLREANQQLELLQEACKRSTRKVRRLWAAVARKRWGHYSG